MASYEDCGVSIKDNDLLVATIKGICQSTYTPGVLTGIGGFCSLYNIPGTDLTIAATTDGIGSKLQLADQLDEYGQLKIIGFDLVGMVINDLLPCGARPLFFLDYLAIQSIATTRDKILQILSGVAAACHIADVALVGGETAEMASLFPSSSHYDIAGFGVGLVNRSDIKGSHLVELRVSVIGVASSGPHSNGYSLIRKIFSEEDWQDEEIRHSIMRPTTIYSRMINNILSPAIHAMAHITGGGLVDNTMRSVPDNLDIDWDLPEMPEVFQLIDQKGDVGEEEMRKVFNCGIGFVLIVKERAENQIIRSIDNLGYKAFKVGKVINKV